MSITEYATYFKEKSWDKFVSYNKGVAEKMPKEQISQLDDTCIPTDVKMVIITLFGERAKEWVRRGIPILGGKSALELVTSEEGLKALKVGLMRMPD